MLSRWGFTRAGWRTGTRGEYWVLAYSAVRSLGSSLTPLPHPRDDAKLVESGIYSFARYGEYATRTRRFIPFLF